MTDIYKAFPNSSLPLREEYEDLFEIFSSNDLTSTDLLIMSQKEIATICDRSITEINSFLSELKKDIRDSLSNRLENGMLLEEKQSHKIQFNIPHKQPFAIPQDCDTSDQSNYDDPNEKSISITQAIGGFPFGSITEVVGESATGKTHFLMQLSATIQTRRKKRQTIFITTEGGGLVTQRLKTIIDETNKLYNEHKSKKPSRNRVTTDNIHTFNCLDGEELLHVLNYQVPTLIDRYDIGMVIIDSIAAHFRGMNSRLQNNKGQKNEQEADNYQVLKELISSIKQITRQKNVAFVISNQVADRFWKTFDNSLDLNPAEEGQKFNGFQPGRSIDSLMSHNQIRWYSGWDNVSLLRNRGNNSKPPFQTNNEYQKIVPAKTKPQKEKSPKPDLVEPELEGFKEGGSLMHLDNEIDNDYTQPIQHQNENPSIHDLQLSIEEQDEVFDNEDDNKLLRVDMPFNKAEDSDHSGIYKSPVASSDSNMENTKPLDIIKPNNSTVQQISTHDPVTPHKRKPFEAINVNLSDFNTSNPNQHLFYESNDPDLQLHDTGKVPTLGLIWANNIDQRVVLKKKKNKRFLHVAFSSWSPSIHRVKKGPKSFRYVREIEFEIWAGGIRDIPK